MQKMGQEMSEKIGHTFKAFIVKTGTCSNRGWRILLESGEDDIDAGSQLMKITRDQLVQVAIVVLPE